MTLIHFLLVYDHDAGRLVAWHQFADASAAAAEYEKLERKHQGDSDLEIVLVGADSIDTIKQTHGNYFDGDAEVVEATPISLAHR